MWPQGRQAARMAAARRKVDFTHAELASPLGKPQLVACMCKAGKRLVEFVLIPKTFRADLLGTFTKKPVRSPYTHVLIRPSPTLPKVDEPLHGPPERPGRRF
jgi:hypothetical protein